MSKQDLKKIEQMINNIAESSNTSYTSNSSNVQNYFLIIVIIILLIILFSVCYSIEPFKNIKDFFSNISNGTLGSLGPISDLQKITVPTFGSCDRNVIVMTTEEASKLIAPTSCNEESQTMKQTSKPGSNVYKDSIGLKPEVKENFGSKIQRR